MTAESVFRFCRFEVRNRDSALKVGTDAVVLGASMTILPSDRAALDIGTGTGVIAVMAAQRSVDCRIVGIDSDPASASEASFNFRSSPWADRLSAVCSPLSEFVTGQKFDLIFSNPPYYDASLKNPDPREAAARHTDSLSYREILSFASSHLVPGGRLSLILPSDRLRDLRRCAASFGLHPFRQLHIRTVPGKPPRRVIVEFSTVKRGEEEAFLTLMNGGERTEEYRSLTREFYL